MANEERRCGQVSCREGVVAGQDGGQEQRNGDKENRLPRS